MCVGLYSSLLAWLACSCVVSLPSKTKMVSTAITLDKEDGAGSSTFHNKGGSVLDFDKQNVNTGPIPSVLSSSSDFSPLRLSSTLLLDSANFFQFVSICFRFFSQAFVRYIGTGGCRYCIGHKCTCKAWHEPMPFTCKWEIWRTQMISWTVNTLVTKILIVHGSRTQVLAASTQRRTGTWLVVFEENTLALDCFPPNMLLKIHFTCIHDQKLPTTQTKEKIFTDLRRNNQQIMHNIQQWINNRQLYIKYKLKVLKKNTDSMPNTSASS